MRQLEGRYVEPVYDISVHRLCEDIDITSERTPWGCFSRPLFHLVGTVTEEEIKLAANHSHMDVAYDIPWERYHAARVIWLLRNEDKLTEPISVDCMCDGGNIYAWADLLDGNHRLAAHVWGDRDLIRAHYGGREDFLEYLTGETDIRPKD